MDAGTHEAAGQVFSANSWIWAPDDEHVYIPAKVKAAFQKGHQGDVYLEGGDASSFTVLSSETSAKCTILDEQSLGELDNMVQFRDLSEGPLLHNLRKRYSRNCIYTYVGTILVAINPFKKLPIYTPEVLKEYIASSGQVKLPHVFATAAAAYSQLTLNKRSQAICISGESGAGKTETMKFMLQFLAEVSGKSAQSTNASVAASAEDSRANIEDKILATNPLTEGIGNAKTLRNDNSSRFGKWTSLHFSSLGNIYSAEITQYLLEKSRVTFQNEGERNYHIFYQLFAACHSNPSLQKRLQLETISKYNYVNQSSTVIVSGIDDGYDFDQLRTAMVRLRIPEADIDHVFDICAAVLHLGNMKFELSDADEARCIDRAPLETAAKLFQVEAAELEEQLISKNIGTHSVVRVPYTVEEACNARDVMAKHTYGRLFDWLIKMLNRGLGATENGNVATTRRSSLGADLVVGVLDIFGFEFFETNSFEQLCINLTNEKLQFHFNEHIFVLELQTYEDEGIDVKRVTFDTNEPTLELLEGKPSGIFSLLDEEVKIGARGKDDNFLSKILQAHGAHQNFERPKPKQKDSRLCFNIRHYAATVAYNVTNFVIKNRDELLIGLKDVGHTSKNDVMVAIFPVEHRPSRVERGKKKQATTLGQVFRTQLSKLMAALGECEPHFVRCIKPNHDKLSGQFNSEMVVSQMRCAGLLEVCRIRKMGFPVRLLTETFFERYSMLDPAATSASEMLESLTQQGSITVDGYAIGTTKIFLRDAFRDHLESLRDDCLMSIVIRIQRTGRRFVVRKRYLVHLRTVAKLRTVVADRNFSMLAEALKEAYTLPFRGRSLPVVKEAQELAEVFEGVKSLKNKLSEANRKKQLEPFRALLEEARSNADFRSTFQEDLAQAEKAFAVLERTPLVLKALQEAVVNRDMAALNEALAEAAEIGLDNGKAREAKRLVKLLQEEEDCRTNLKAALDARQMDQIEVLLTAAAELGMGDEALVVSARQFCVSNKKQIECAEAVRSAIVTARQTREWASLLKCVEEKSTLCPEDRNDDFLAVIAAANALITEIKEELVIIQELADAASGDDIGRLEAAIPPAKALETRLEEAGLFRGRMDLQGAREKLARMKTESKIVQDIDQAVVLRDAKSLREVLTQSLSLGFETHHPALLKASKVLGELESEAEKREAMEQQAKAEEEARLKKASIDERLRAAVLDEDVDEVGNVLNEATAMGYYESPDIIRARKFRKQRAEQRQLEGALASAMEAQDLHALRVVVEQADAAGFKGAELARAKGSLRSLNLKSAAREQLESALVQSVFEPLEMALQNAREHGIEAQTLERASAKLLSLQRLKAAFGEIEKACASQDRAKLESALQTAAAEGGQANHPSGGGKVMTLGEAKLAELISIEQLVDAIDTADKALDECSVTTDTYDDLKRALEAPEFAESGPDSSDPTSDGGSGRLSDVGRGYAPLVVVQGAIDDDDDLDSGELREGATKANNTAELDPELIELLEHGRELLDKLDEFLSLNMDSDNHFSNCPCLKSLDEWASKLQKDSEAILSVNGRMPKSQFLTHQSFPLHTSLTKHPDATCNAQERLRHENSAILAHRMLLVFCGEIPHENPVELGHSLLQRVHASKVPGLQDEVYLQLCKHLTKNPDHESAYRGFRFMALMLMTIKCEDFMRPYLRQFLSVAFANDRVGMGPVISDVLQKLEAVSDNRAEIVRSTEMISVFCFSEKHHILVKVREWIMKDQMVNILEVKRCMDALERAMKQHVIPMETVEAVNLAIRCPGDYECVSDAWHKLQQYAHTQKLLDHFTRICDEASELAMHPEGVEEHQLLDVQIHIYWAKITPLCGVKEKALTSAEALARRLEAQVEVKQELTAAISRRSVEPLRKAIAFADMKGSFSHLRAYRLAKDILEDLSANDRFLSITNSASEDTFLNRIANQFNSRRTKRLSMHLKTGTWELNQSPGKKDYFKEEALDNVGEEDEGAEDFHDTFSQGSTEKLDEIGEDPWSATPADDDAPADLQVDELPVGDTSPSAAETTPTNGAPEPASRRWSFQTLGAATNQESPSEAPAWQNFFGLAGNGNGN